MFFFCFFSWLSCNCVPFKIYFLLSMDTVTPQCLPWKDRWDASPWAKALKKSVCERTLCLWHRICDYMWMVCVSMWDLPHGKPVWEQEAGFLLLASVTCASWSGLVPEWKPNVWRRREQKHGWDRDSACLFKPCVFCCACFNSGFIQVGDISTQHLVPALIHLGTQNNNKPFLFLEGLCSWSQVQRCCMLGPPLRWPSPCSLISPAGWWLKCPMAAPKYPKQRNSKEVIL